MNKYIKIIERFSKMNKFDRTYNRIIKQYVDNDVIEQGLFDIFKKKDKDSADVKSAYCMKLWNDKNYQKLAKELVKYKKENKKEFSNDPQAIFYYGVMLLKDLISESKLNLLGKGLLLESKAVKTDQEQMDIVSHDIDKKHLKKIVRKAKFGDADAIYDLAICYYVGVPDLLKQNVQKAVKLFKKAAKKGCAEAQYNLGVMYEKGYDRKDKEHQNEFENYIQKDEDLAYKYYARALQNGYEDAREPLEYLLTKKKNEKADTKDKPQNFTNSIKRLKKGLEYIQIAAKAGLEEAKAFLEKYKDELEQKQSMFIQLKEKQNANAGALELSLAKH